MAGPSTTDDERVLLATIAAGTTAACGEEFFAVLVKSVAQAMGVRGAWVTEWNPSTRRLRALSFWFGDDYFGDYEYDVHGTPCEAVVTNRKLHHVPERVIELFPEDESLVPLHAVSYLGVPLEDVDGELLGHLAILHDQPLPPDARSEDLLHIFAGRAAVELQRLRRDRVLNEQRQKLRRLFDGTLDAIVELDAGFRVTQVNGAAVELFGEGVLGAPFEEHLTRSAGEKLRTILLGLGQDGAPPMTFVPEGLDCLGTGGAILPAEATVSGFEDGGETYFAVILRSIAERMRAEATIDSLTREAESLRRELGSLNLDLGIVGESAAIRRVLFDVEQVAETDATVLITGETGTGKELAARAIHRRSSRADRPLIKVNCAAIPTNLQESEFFGHERGAFTGATSRREGRFKLAHRGTLFLDEVGELPLDLQAKLLRVLQEGEFEPVGSNRTEVVDVRLIAATNRDLKVMVAEGTFREDLYYRLNVFPLMMPPLREREGDVVLLAEAILGRLARERGREAMRLTPEARAHLLAYEWPGNVRELQNVLERAVITSRDGTLNLATVLQPMKRTSPPAAPGAEGSERILTTAELTELERRNTLRALEASGWKIAGSGGAAELLGLRPNTLASRMKALGLRRQGSR